MTDATLEAEAESIADLFNGAKADHSPALEWFAMSTHRGDGQAFVFELVGYADRDGLAALREHGRTIRYIESHGYDDSTILSFEIAVTGSEAGR